MRTIYVDAEKKCHVTDDGTMTPVETSFFDGKCDTFVEGYCYDIQSKAIYPWASQTALENAQRDYERKRLRDAENALAILLGGTV